METVRIFVHSHSLQSCNLDLQIIVESMHERKVEMARRVGSFVGLPGGFGTFEEACPSPNPLGRPDL